MILMNFLKDFLASRSQQSFKVFLITDAFLAQVVSLTRLAENNGEQQIAGTFFDWFYELIKSPFKAKMFMKGRDKSDPAEYEVTNRTKKCKTASKAHSFGTFNVL